MNILKSTLTKISILILSCYFLSAATTPNNQQNNDTLTLLNLFGDVFDKVKKDYVVEPSDQELIESSINGMLSSLDPHSSYLDAKALAELQVQTKGEFGGLGIEVTMENGLIKVISAIDDTPAFRGGFKTGDYIISIDNEPVMGLTLNEAVKKMRGKPATKIKLTIIREGNKEPIDITLIREIIKIRPVKSRKEGTDIGYIRINSFSEQTAESVMIELKKLKGELGNHFAGLILDLRNNPGGLLDQGIKVSDMFLDRGEIVSTKGRMKDSIKRYNAKSGDIAKNIPIIVLINGGSASAAEIVAGALQDHKRAVIMGTKSFGKGSVQTIIPIQNYGAIRLTTARYYTPSGRSIQAEGIIPDITVEQAKIEPLDNKSIVSLYSEANLPGHLANDQEYKKGEGPKTTTPDMLQHNKTDKSAVPTKPESLSDKDYQLARAVDLLRGMQVYDNLKTSKK